MSKIEVPANSVPGEGSLSDLHTAAFWLCPHVPETDLSHVSFSHKAPALWIRDPPLDLI